MLGLAAEKEAVALGVPMAVSLADGEGLPLYFGRMDGALPAATDIAVSKAYTAAVLRMPTHEVGKLAQPGSMLYGIQNTHGGRIVLFGGGFPLKLGGKVAGGVGISGGTVDEDMRVALPVVELLAQMESCSFAIKEILPQDLKVEDCIGRLETILPQALSQAYGNVPAGLSVLLTGAIYLAAAKTT
ncbi:MAG: heme-binding protein [Deltaproteobacteria bacterium]|nr:heme-binding protein [Deltaproteobacteria bacterium]